MPEPTFESIAVEVAALVEDKNRAYGSSFDNAGTFVRLLWPNGVPAESVDDLLAFVRIWDKMMRVATNPTAFGEDPRRDMLGYCLLNCRRVALTRAATKRE